MSTLDTLPEPTEAMHGTGSRVRAVVAVATGLFGMFCFWSSGVDYLSHVGLLVGGCVTLAAWVAFRRIRDPHGIPPVDLRPIGFALGAAWAGSVALSWAGVGAFAPAWVTCVVGAFQIVESRLHGVLEWCVCGVVCLLAGAGGMVAGAWGVASSWAVAGYSSGWAFVVTSAISAFRVWPRAGRERH